MMTLVRKKRRREVGLHKPENEKSCSLVSLYLRSFPLQGLITDH